MYNKSKAEKRFITPRSISNREYLQGLNTMFHLKEREFLENVDKNFCKNKFTVADHTKDAFEKVFSETSKLNEYTLDGYVEKMIEQTDNETAPEDLTLTVTAYVDIFEGKLKKLKSRIKNLLKKTKNDRSERILIKLLKEAKQLHNVLKKYRTNVDKIFEK